MEDGTFVAINRDKRPGRETRPAHPKSKPTACVTRLFTKFIGSGSRNCSKSAAHLLVWPKDAALEGEVQVRPHR